MSLPAFDDQEMFTTERSRIASAVRALPPSGIRKFFDMVLAMDDVVSLGVGEPDFQTPWVVREKAIEELELGRTSYTSNHGLLELRQELAAWLAERYQVSYDPLTEIVITVGASEAIDLALRAMLERDDEVIVVQPCYVSYAPTVVLAGGKPIIFSTYQKDAFRINFDALRPMVTPRTRAIMVNYPSNPTGTTFTREDLEKLASFASDHDLIVISDEIYGELTYVGKHISLASLPGMKDRTILINGFSKAFAMTGWRIGYACGPEEIISAMVKIHQYTMLCAPTVSQFAAMHALRHCDQDVEAMRRDYEKRGKFIVRGLNEIGIKTLQPEGAFYAFGNISETGLSSEDFCAQLLHTQKVAVVPGTAFGACGEGLIRASYAASFDRIEQALHGLSRFLGR
jgi:aminotransferase